MTLTRRVLQKCTRAAQNKSTCRPRVENPSYVIQYEQNKCKAVPLRNAVAKGERKYSSYSFLTSALDGGEWSVTPRPLFTPGKVKNPRYLLDRKLGRPQSWSGHRRQRKYPFHLPGIEPQSSVDTILTELPQLLQSISCRYSSL
jgi:hypothetical protein